MHAPSFRSAFRFSAVVALACGLSPAQDPPVDPGLLRTMKARSVGPAGMSGRVTALAIERGDPNTFYVGAATGGLWKTEDGGLSFEPIFDDQNCASIGALAIHPAREETVWVGTGEGNPRNSVSVGRGVFRSVDGGRTWQHLGLDKTERIRRIALHPTNPDIAYVAALGTTWGESEQRGVYKTTDGGVTWNKVLEVDEKTGCANLVMDPSNPDKLFANMWDHRRWPWSFRSGGPGSGLYRTLDGGETWTKLGTGDGLPKGDLGRIGLAIAPSDPDVVYALVEAKKSVLLRSDDGGFSFRTVNRDDDIAPRPFYYADIRVDPFDADRLINMHTVVTVSEDGGKSWSTLIPYNEIHPDHHAMVLHPTVRGLIVEGNDGGISISRDGGKSWRYAPNLPLGQFYHIAVDMDRPYHIYGGMQDNGSWRGPSAVWENGGIRNHHWSEVCFGDGFNTLPDPTDSMQGYAMSQQGNLVRWNLRTGSRKSIKPGDPEDVELRFNWNAALAQDPFDDASIYFGSQFVHHSADRGETWRTISPDLTTNHAAWQKQDESGGLTYDVTGAENYTTIIAIAPSPVERGLVWAGTDDGRLHVTRDGGESWTSLEARLPDLPRHTWCPHIEASPHTAGTAFAVFDDHRRANWTPYVYRTDDYGETWTNIATDAIDGYCLVALQDPVDPDLLFVGSEFGLWVSVDAGKNWWKWTHGLPTVSTIDLAIHPRDHDLIVGTHGRAAFVIDDIQPLRDLAENHKKRIHVFDGGDAFQVSIRQTEPPRFAGATEYRGENERTGARLSIWASGDDLEHPDPDVRKEEEAAANEDRSEAPKAKVTITNGDGEIVDEFERKLHRGLNRFYWRMRGEDGVFPMRGVRKENDDDDGPGSGPTLPPGTYTIEIALGEDTTRTNVVVHPDPRTVVVDADIEEILELQQQAREHTERLDAWTQSLAKALHKVKRVQTLLSDIDEKDDAQKALEDAAKTAKKEIVALQDEIFGPEKDARQGIVGGESLMRRLSAGWGLGRNWAKVTQSQKDQLERAKRELDALAERVQALLDGSVTAFNEALPGVTFDLAADVTTPDGK